MSEVSAGYAQHSILIFHVIPSCPERGQQVKRNPNLNSAEVLCAACFQESGINKKESPKLKLPAQGSFPDFLSRKSKAIFAAKRNEHLKNKT